MISFSKVMKLFWIKKLLDNDITTGWKTLVLDQLSRYGGNIIWSYESTSLKVFSKFLNPFWKNLVDIWSEVKEGDNIDFLSRTLWHNANLTIGGKVFYFKSWSQVGINYINDLVNDQGEIYPFNDFVDIYDLPNDIMRYNSVKSAIPQDWKRLIKDGNTKHDIVTNKCIEMLKKSNANKYFYEIFKKKYTLTPEKSQAKWKQKIGKNELDFENYYLKIMYIKDLSLRNYP